MRPKKFDDLIKIDIMRALIDEFKASGKQFFYKNSKGVLVDCTESFFSGGLFPVLIYQMNRRLFVLREGREMCSLFDYYRHNLNISFFYSARVLCSAEVGLINEDHLPIAKDEFIFLLRDALYFTFNELPMVADTNGGIGKPNQRDISPLLDTFKHWLGIHQQTTIAALKEKDPNIKTRGVELDPKIVTHVIAETLERLNNGKKSPYFTADFISKPFSELLKEVDSSNEIEIQLV